MRRLGVPPPIRRLWSILDFLGNLDFAIGIAAIVAPPAILAWRVMNDAATWEIAVSAGSLAVVAVGLCWSIYRFVKLQRRREAELKTATESGVKSEFDDRLKNIEGQLHQLVDSPTDPVHLAGQVGWDDSAGTEINREMRMQKMREEIALLDTLLALRRDLD